MPETIRFPVEAAHVMMFARAVGDPNPVFVDEAAARSQGLPGIVVPPTFPIAADHFDPAYERRPLPGVPWFGSGARAISVEGGSQQAAGGGSGFHAEEHFVYHRPLVVGDVVFGEAHRGRSWEKSGRRGGRLHFSEDIVDYRDEAGVAVVTARWVNVLTEKVVGADASQPEPPAPRATASAPDANEGWTLRADDAQARVKGEVLHVGAEYETLLVEDLRRTQIVMYAGASGDFHPMHTDATYASAMGMDGVFAHGMLSMGISGRALTDLVGPGCLADYGARFRGQVWPGDTLRACVRVAGVVERGGRQALRLALETRNQRDEVVLSGGAHAWVDA